MSEKKSRVKLSPEEWAEFREAYLKAFETMPRTKAYAAAVHEMRLQNKPYPSFRTLPASGTPPPPHLRKRRSPRRRHGPPMPGSGRRTDD